MVNFGPTHKDGFAPVHDPEGAPTVSLACVLTSHDQAAVPAQLGDYIWVLGHPHGPEDN